MNVARTYLEAVYRRSLSAPRWLEGIVDAARPTLDAGLGVAALSFSVAEGGILKTTAAMTSIDDMEPGLFEVDARVRVAEQAARAVPQGSSHVAITQMAARRGTDNAEPKAVLWLIATHPESGAIAIAAPRSPGYVQMRRERSQSERMAGHLACALRLRCLPDGQGTPEHAGHPMRFSAPLSADGLRSAAIAADAACAAFARCAMGSPHPAWQRLLQGELRQIDSFENDGRRYIVARREGELIPQGGLTARQRHMLVMRSAGHSLKYIAGELDCSISTVSSEIVRALRLLGVRSAGELSVPESPQAPRAGLA